VRYTSGTAPTTYRYTGQREEASFGLYYYNARWYDPALGRFAQADSIVPGGVQGLDRYAYVNNNPVNYTDPSGHNSQLQDGGVTFFIVVSVISLFALAATAISVNDIYVYNAPELFAESTVEVLDDLSEAAADTIQKNSTELTKIPRMGETSPASFFKKAGGAATIASHLATLLQKPVAGFNPHPGKDPNDDSIKKLIKEITNQLQEFKKNIGENSIEEYLKKKNWNPKQIQNFIKELQDFTTYILPAWEDNGIVNPGTTKTITNLTNKIGIK